MEDLTIHTHDFEQSKNQLKLFAEKNTCDLDIERVESDKKAMKIIGDFFLGRGFDTEHRVTGNELNELATQVQNHFISINNMQRDFINEFGQVYTALEALDRDYIQAILIAVKSAQKANGEARIAQDNIERTIEEQKKIIKVLQKFKEKLDNYNHIEDIDKMWEYMSEFEGELADNRKAIRVLSDFKNGIERNKHIYEIDNIWKDNRESKKEIEGLIAYTLQIDESIDKLNTTIEVLQSKKKKLERIKHLEDIDKIWDISQDNIKKIDGLAESAMQLAEVVEGNRGCINDILKDIAIFDEMDHLTDVDQIWNDVRKCNINIESISEQIEGLIAKYEKQSNNLGECKKVLDMITIQKHISEVDEMWSDVEKHGEAVQSIIYDLKNCTHLIETKSEIVDMLKRKIDEFDVLKHLFDIDTIYDKFLGMECDMESMRKDKAILEKDNNMIKCRLEDINKLQEMGDKIVNRMKKLYLLSGGAIGVAIISFILVLLGLK